MFNEGSVEALYIGSLTVEEHLRVTGERKQIPKSEFVCEESADIYWRPQGERRVAVGRLRGNETTVAYVEYGTKACGGTDTSAMYAQ